MNYIKKDITTVEAPAVIMHGVNCQRNMGNGLAKAIYSKWPQVKEEYMLFTKDEMILSKIAPVKIEDRLFIINCWTQKQFGYDDQVYADYNAIENCLNKVISFCKSVEIKNIYSPRIGCGLGGLDWTEVQAIFYKAEQLHPEIKITICDFNEYKTGDKICI